MVNDRASGWRICMKLELYQPKPQGFQQVESGDNFPQAWGTISICIHAGWGPTGHIATLARGPWVMVMLCEPTVHAHRE